MAPGTLRNKNAAWKRFEAFCADCELNSGSVGEPELAMFVAWMSLQGTLNRDTIEKYLREVAGVLAVERGAEKVGRSRQVVLALRGMRRELGDKTKRARPLEVAELGVLVRACRASGEPRRAALAWVMTAAFWGAFRLGEVTKERGDRRVRWDRECVERVGPDVLLTLYYTKTDQEGAHRQTKVLEPLGGVLAEVCPVRAWNEAVAEARHHRGHLTSDVWTYRNAVVRVQRWLPDRKVRRGTRERLSGHSFKRGLSHLAVRLEAPVEKVVHFVGWADERMFRLYSEGEPRRSGLGRAAEARAVPAPARGGAADGQSRAARGEARSLLGRWEEAAADGRSEPADSVGPRAEAAGRVGGGDGVEPVAEHEDEEEDEGDEFEVDSILDTRVGEGGREEYLVRWVGYGEEGDTWEPFENVRTAEQALRVYFGVPSVEPSRRRRP